MVTVLAAIVTTSDGLRKSAVRIDSSYYGVCMYEICVLGEADKQWPPTPVSVRSVAEQNGTQSATSTPSTISPAPETNDEDYSKSGYCDYEKRDEQRNIRDYRLVFVCGILLIS